VSTLFFTFVKIGSVLFGSGYVLLAFLHADFVVRLGWLTEAQLLDAVAVGQVTPGPLFTTATFVGYLLDGLRGASVATLGIFLPAFAFVALSLPLVPSWALMAGVSVRLARGAVVDGLTAVLAAAALWLAWRRVSTTLLVVGAALVGVLSRGL
jgi:chromate transporter